MADPAIIFGVITGAVGLALQCGTVAQQLYNLSSKFKKAELTIRCLADECETIKLAWSRIEQWTRLWADDAAADLQVLDRLNKSILTGTMIMSALENDLSRHELPMKGFRQKVSVIWKEGDFADHRERIKGMVDAVHLLVDVIKLPLPEDRSNLLAKGSEILRHADESVMTIIQTRPSTQVASTRSNGTVESGDLVHKPLSIDRDLFAGRVYQRNYIRLIRLQVHRLIRGPETQGQDLEAQQIMNHDHGTDKTSPDDNHSTVISTVGLQQRVMANYASGAPNWDYQVSEIAEDSEALRSILNLQCNMTSGIHEAEDSETIRTVSRLQGDDDGQIKDENEAQRDCNANSIFSKPEGEEKHSFSEDFGVFEDSDMIITTPRLGGGEGRYIQRSVPTSAIPANFPNDEIISSIVTASQAERTDTWLLDVATSQRRFDVLEKILAAPMSDTNSKWMHSTYFKACEDGNEQMVDVLVRCGTDVNCTRFSMHSPYSDKKETGLGVAAYYGRIVVAKYLLQHGASVRIHDRNVIVPLETAIGQCHYAMTALLIDAGAAVACSVESGYRSLHIAVKTNQLNTISLLIKAGAALNLQDGWGSTPTHWAANKGHSTALSLLIKAGAALNLQDCMGYTPTHCAASKGNSEALSLLIQAGAALNLQDRWGSTPTHCAANRGNREALSLLVKAGAALNSQDRWVGILAAEKGRSGALSHLFGRVQL